MVRPAYRPDVRSSVFDPELIAVLRARRLSNARSTRQTASVDWSAAELEHELAAAFQGPGQSRKAPRMERRAPRKGIERSDLDEVGERPPGVYGSL